MPKSAESPVKFAALAAEGRVRAVTTGRHTLALTRFAGLYVALSITARTRRPSGRGHDREAIAHDGPALVEAIADSELV